MKNLSINKENTQKALKLYLSEMIFEDKFDDLLLFTQYDIKTILKELNNGTMSPKLANGIVKILGVDIDILVGERKLSYYENERYREYCVVNDERDILSKMYNIVKEVKIESEILKAGGYTSLDVIEENIKSKQIPFNIKKEFSKVLNSSLDELYKCNKNQILSNMPKINQNDGRGFSFLDILFNNGLLEQTNEFMYTPKKDISEESKKINEKIDVSIEISKYKMVRKYSRVEFDKLIYWHSSYRSGFNFKVIAELDNYRFQEVDYVNESYNYSQQRYFILDFNEVDKDEKNTYAKSVYEVDLKTFYSMISDICSAQLDVQQKFEVDKAKKDLDDIKKFIRLFIDKYNKLLKLEAVLVG
ncbi:hypothetical protein [Clostridium botulinum]|uniref:hypothetical protein n=1 Tax=Clostridium botulinum TaxID=1491 RepID=UPI0007737704|nr:hypothetical protein [Clostridium botulinum]MBY6930902.1 hypothetical protein [Clostridium botulinum]NFG21131.1 hypothetical protein [Clostridium botulinum]NFO80007.1 hypothetical protein [Clostridium botulinum]